MNLKDIAIAVRDVYRRLGCLDGTAYLLSRGLTRVSRGRIRLHKYRFIAQPVSAQRWLRANRGSSVEVREVVASDPILLRLPRPPGTMANRARQGAVCLGAFKEGECAGVLWLVMGPFTEEDGTCRYVPLPEGCASWDFDLYIYPEHRNSLVFLRLWDEANCYLMARGGRWSLSRISAFNPDSMAAHSRMGARQVAAAIFLSFGSMQLSAATVRPRLFWSFRSGHFPTFVLDAERLVRGRPSNRAALRSKDPASTAGSRG